MIFFFPYIQVKFQSSVISHLGIADLRKTGNSDMCSWLMFGGEKKYGLCISKLSVYQQKSDK